jgi:hypothetical protein
MLDPERDSSTAAGDRLRWTAVETFSGTYLGQYRVGVAAERAQQTGRLAHRLLTSGDVTDQ